MATNANVEMSETVYRYPMPWWYWSLLIPAGFWAWVCFDLIWMMRKWGWAGGGSFPPALLQLVLAASLLMASQVWAVVRRRVMETNTWVRLDDDGITMSDWRRRISHLAWEDVQEMHWRFGKASAPGSTMHVRGEGRTLRIPVEDLRGRLGPLAEEIAARAGLKCVHEGWLDIGARFEA